MDNSICQVYEDIIQSLEEEIKLLAEKYEDSQQESTFFSDEEILMSIKSFQREFQGESKGCESPSDLKAQLESLETDLSFLMKFTGIQFTSHSKKTVEKTRNRTVQKHRLSGNCHSLSFQLEFQLLEMRMAAPVYVMPKTCTTSALMTYTRNKESVSAVVSDLSIIMESGEDSDVSKFVSSTEEHGNLLTFFRSLSSYAEWYEHRRCTFLHFKVPVHSDFGRELLKREACVTLSVLSAKHKKKQYASIVHSQDEITTIVNDEHKLNNLSKTFSNHAFKKGKYPDVVTLPEGLLGDYITLRNPKLSGFELMIVWKIHIDEEGRTTPVLDLLTKVPEQVLEQKTAAIENAPARFRCMLLLFGIETAIENLIKVVALEK